MSWHALFARKQIADGRNGFGNQPPRTIGSSASRLMNKIDGSHYSVKLSDQEWRTVWLWIESAAPYAGTYAALRNEREMGLGGFGYRVFKEQNGVLKQRCQTCHRAAGEAPVIPYGLPEYPDTRGLKRPLARHERRVIEHDPYARFSVHALVNMSRPELSPLILGPLVKEAGGWGSCSATVFTSKDDPDYRRLLASLRSSKVGRDTIPRYATSAWRPNAQYIRERKRFEVLPPTFDLARESVDPFEIDRRYWASLHLPGGAGR